MPIDTPKHALTLDELPTAGPNDPGIQAVVMTATGAKKLPLGVLFEPYTILIGSYQFYTSAYPTAFAIPMMGGVLDPADFDDNLQVLKQRVPNDWIRSDGKIQLPLVLDHVLQQDLGLQPGALQDDAVQNVKGNFGGAGRVGSGGVFSQSGVIGYQSNAGKSDNWSTSVSMDLSRQARTADKTRECTLNAVLCVITGQNKATTTKTYYVINQDHGAYAGWTIDLPVGRDGQGIGFNAAVMTDKEPAEFSQAALAAAWTKDEQSDPLALAMSVRTRSKWDLSRVENIYRTFRIGGKDVFVSVDMSGVKVMGGDGTDSIVFTGQPTYNTSAGFGSGYGVTYNCTSVVINGADFTLFSITGLQQVTVWLRVKGSTAILSLVTNGKPVDAAWWQTLTDRCPPDKQQDLKRWLARMPNGVYNAQNTQDTLDNIPTSRFYLHASGFSPKIPSQSQLWTAFQAAAATDTLGLYAAALLPDFALSNLIAKPARTFWLDGREVEVEATHEGIKFSVGQHYLMAKATPRVGQQTTYYGQNQQVIYDFTPQSYYVGVGGREVNLTNGWTFKALICAKEDIIFVSFPGQSNYNTWLNFDRVKELISHAPGGEEAAVNAAFDVLPKDFENTTNQDAGGENWGVGKSRFWMQGEK